MTNQITDQRSAVFILFSFGSIIFLAATWNFAEYPPSRLPRSNGSQAA
jgi:hypothetical protein